MAKRESTGVDPFARLAGKAKQLDKLFKTTNPNKETELSEGVYIGLITKIKPRSIGKANEEQHPAVGIECIALCDKDGNRDDIYGKGASGIFVIKETEKQTLGDAFARLIYFFQDSLLLDTKGMSVKTISSDIADIQALLDDSPHLVTITVSLGTNGRKNVNFGSAVTPEQLAETAGIKMKEVSSDFRDSNSSTVKGKAKPQFEDDDEEGEEEDEEEEFDNEDTEDEEEDEEEEEYEEDDEDTEDEEEGEEEDEEEDEEEEEEYTPPPKKLAAKKAVAKKAVAKKKR